MTNPKKVKFIVGDIISCGRHHPSLKIVTIDDKEEYCLADSYDFEFSQRTIYNLKELYNTHFKVLNLKEIESLFPKHKVGDILLDNDRGKILIYKILSVDNSKFFYEVHSEQNPNTKKYYSRPADSFWTGIIKEEYLYNQPTKEKDKLITLENGTKIWTIANEKSELYAHRLSGPAIEYSDKSHGFYIYGKQISKESFYSDPEVISHNKESLKAKISNL